jgi:hypothetical protein
VPAAQPIGRTKPIPTLNRPSGTAPTENPDRIDYPNIH